MLRGWLGVRRNYSGIGGAVDGENDPERIATERLATPPT